MNQNVPLSKRLKLIADYLPDGANFADIGSDHAYLPAYVCLSDKTARAIAGEVNQGPLESAKKTIQLHQLEEQIDARSGDGLAVLKEGEVEQIVIAGMGGSLITSILEKSPAIAKSAGRIIAQPNVDARVVRQWFNQNDFILIAEEIVGEQGHIYEILVADRHTNVSSPYNDNPQIKDKQLLLGPYLLAEKNNTFIKKWSLEEANLERIISQMQQAKQVNQEKISAFQTELQWIKEELHHEETNT
ncbi:tRNA (adenine(22)-N(1))-methyltransferase [Oceanobacillus neutriphilus]|uniref:SAM-dependent methyltransferase n=1 Tax=Oceanobacillus neutriphilus TaxID=531815 RepID=A0ABQ2NWZ4_9BACI|nr:class I SAM-dependent methyltransferase [Oceanobacillus neutriphilus]GGP12696.1 SAM-dependent methyltransferase [Oceanobacillus neutriphilus]